MGFRGNTGSGGGGSITFAPPSAQIDLGDGQVEGTSGAAARADHQHAFPAGATPPALAATSSAGAATTPARSDHTHAHTAAAHLAGGHADLSGHYEAAGTAAAALVIHQTTYDHATYDAAVAALPSKLDTAAHAAIDHTGLTGVPVVLNDLANVAVAGATTGDTIEYDGTNWGLAPGTPTAAPLNIARHFFFGG